MASARVYDCDAHLIEPSDLWSRYLDQRFKHLAPTVRNGTISIGGTHAPRFLNPAHPMPQPHLDVEALLRQMDVAGVERQVLYPSLGLYVVGWPKLPDDHERALVRAYNAWVAELLAGDDSQRLGAVGLVTPLEPEEVHKCALMGLKGVTARPNPWRGQAHGLGTIWEDVYAACEANGLPLCLHEGSGARVPTLADERYDDPVICHALSHPLEMIAACGGLMLTGTFEHYRRLKVAFVEAGAGWVPYLMRRLDEHAKLRPELALNPSGYMRAQCFVTCEPDEPLAPLFTSGFGRCVVFGTDHPHFDSHHPHAVQMFEGLAGVSEMQRAEVLWDNGERLYG